MTKIWIWMVSLLTNIRKDRLYHFICGIIIAAFFCMVLKMEYWSIIPVICAGFIKEFIDQIRGGKFDWIDLLATILGGLVIVTFALLTLIMGK